MSSLRHSPLSRRSLAIMTLVIPFAAFAPTGGTAQSATAPHKYVVKDMRNIGPNSVRFAAAQISGDSQAVVLLGGSKTIWPKISDGVQQAEAKGCPVVAILVGPADEAPALEIYAKAHHVTNPINPVTLTQSDLTKLICDVNREYYQ